MEASGRRMSWRSSDMRSPPTQYSRMSHRWLLVSYLQPQEMPGLHCGTSLSVEQLLSVLCTPSGRCGTLMSPSEKPCWHTAGQQLSSPSFMEEAGTSATMSGSCGQPAARLRHHLLLALVPSHL